MQGDTSPRREIGVRAPSTPLPATVPDSDFRGMTIFDIRIKVPA
jgi:hypothetical protein